jgi:DNA-binding transcriptional LysR family regulator
MLSLSLRHLEYAIAIAEHGSVSLAATAIHVSQPALSVAIASLEAHLGNLLFIRRKGSPLILTSYGREFITRASQLVAQFEVLGETGNEFFERRQPIVIGCYEDLGPLLIGPVLAEVKKHYADANISFRIGDFDFLSQEMLTGRIDLSVTYDLGVDTSFVTREITKIHPHVLLYPEHPLTRHKKIGIKDLSDEALVLVDQGHSLWHMVGLFRNHQISPNIVHRVATYEIMRSMVANAHGIGLSYTRSKSAVSYDGKPLEGRNIIDDYSAEPIVIVSNPGNPLSPFARKLEELIAEKSMHEITALTEAPA